MSVSADEVDVVAAAAIAGRSTETVRRWVWSGRLRAHKRGKKLLIARSDVEQRVGSTGARSKPSLAEWLAALEKSGLKSGAGARTAADLVLEDRRTRSYNV